MGLIEGELTMKLPKVYAQEITKTAIDLTLSENPLGCSPAVVNKLNILNPKSVSEYPSDAALKKALARKFNVSLDNVLLGSGSEQLIKLVCTAFLNKNDLVFVPRGSFVLFTKEVLLQKARIRFFDQKSMDITGKPKLCFICNPNNPTGVAISNDQVEKLIRKLPSTLFVIDEANGEFLSESFTKRVKKVSNVIVLRTFSKVFGLAGLRIGFAIGSPNLIQRLSDWQQPFPVSSLSCSLALEALKDCAFITQTLEFFRRERGFLTRELQTRGFDVSDSITNNIFAMTTQAKVIEKELLIRKVGVVDGDFFPGLDTPGFRIAIRDKKTNRLFLQKLDEALACVSNKKLLRSKVAFVARKLRLPKEEL